VVTLKAFRDGSYPFKAGLFSIYVNAPELSIENIKIPKFIRIGQDYEFTIDIKSKNSSGQFQPFKGFINYFLTDRNGKIVAQDTVKINMTSDLNFENAAESKYDEPVNISLNSSQTKNLEPGPSKLKLLVTTFESPKPIIREETLLARP
jgi:peptide/nickel transport system substrate-binding protein